LIIQKSTFTDAAAGDLYRVETKLFALKPSTVNVENQIADLVANFFEVALEQKLQSVNRNAEDLEISEPAQKKPKVGQSEAHLSLLEPYAPYGSLTSEIIKMQLLAIGQLFVFRGQASEYYSSQCAARERHSYGMSVDGQQYFLKTTDVTQLQALLDQGIELKERTIEGHFIQNESLIDEYRKTEQAIIALQRSIEAVDQLLLSDD